MSQEERDTLRIPDPRDAQLGVTGACAEPVDRADAAGPRAPFKVRYWAIAAALLLHMVAIVLCALDWNGIFARALPPLPQAIPVALVIEPPPPEPPPPPRSPEPPQRVTPRMSGADEKTATTAEKPEPAPPVSQQEAEPPKAKPSPSAPSTEAEPPARTASPKAVGRQAAALPPARTELPKGDIFHSIRLPSAPGGREQRDQAGDAYLNRLRDIVERNRVYPPASAFLGGGGERVAVYSILVDPAGNLTALTLLQSSGSTLLDEAAGRMLRASAPFPPLPASYPQMRTLITVEIPMFPAHG